MKRTATAWLLLLCLCLSGCGSFLTGEYLWEQTHYIPPMPDSGQDIVASDYDQLMAVLADSIEQGMEQFTVSVAQYDRNSLQPDIEQAVTMVRMTNPVAAYAVSEINWQVGTSGGEMVLVIEINYFHDASQLQNLLRVADNAEALAAIYQAMDRCDSGIVIYVADYTQDDLVPLLENHAMEAPQLVMETPHITMQIYPETGKSRVLEIRFSYVNSRDALRDMQQQVLTMFESSVNMVSMTEKTKDKYTQLYSLLVERFQKYTIETSITPAYSLLLHGVGDARAFAVVFSAMCREAGLTCQVVAGTKGGKLWYWNIVQVDGAYYHVDLLRSKSEGNLRLLTDAIINEGYVWDFDAYPACGGRAVS
jgi:hypothetical protein